MFRKVSLVVAAGVLWIPAVRAQDQAVNAATIADAVELVLEAGRVAKKLWDRLHSQHPVEFWTGPHVRLPVRYMEDQKSRVSNNIDMSKFAYRVQVCRFRWVAGTVNDHDATSARVTFMADKGGRRDKPRSKSVRAGELFVMFTPTSGDRNYYAARLVADGGREEFCSRNPRAELVLELVAENEIRGAVIAEHDNYMGMGVFVPAGGEIADLRDYGFNDKATSVIIFGNAIVHLYEHSNFRGAQRERSSNDPSLSNERWSDKASSVRVRG